MREGQSLAARWIKHRSWKHVAAPVCIAFAYDVLRHAPEGSLLWYGGLAGAGLVALAYIIEEVIWNLRGNGRACPHCGRRLRMKSFRVYDICPHCRQQF